jgi:thiol-disulfide isomerase/thioredoxin
VGIERVPWIRRLLALLALAVGSAILFALAPGVAHADDSPGTHGFELVLFWGDGCPHCADEHDWLETVRQQYPDLQITEYEVWYHPENAIVMEEWGAVYGFQPGLVPVTVIGDRSWVGFNGPFRTQMESALAQLAAGEQVAADPGEAVISVPLVGDVSLKNSSLVFSTLVIGFVDGVNPCSLWAISMLLAIVVRTGSRRRVIAVGAVFLTVTSAMYALYMAGIYSALSVIGHLAQIQFVVAGLAGVVGIVSVKEYFAFKKGISFTIPESAKPSLYTRMRTAAGADRMLPALTATVGLAIGVSLLETPCTAGFPVIWTGLLAAHGVSAAEAVGLFLLYMIPFLLDEFIVFVVIVLTMRVTRVEEKHARLLKLFAGVTMLALAGTVLFRPEAMNDPLQALLIFTSAFFLAWLIHWVAEPIIRRHSPPPPALPQFDEDDEDDDDEPERPVRRDSRAP